MLNPQGQIIASSQLNIAPRVGFFGDPNQKQISNSIFRKRDDQVFGPVSGVMVQVNEVFPGGMDVTNSEGKYTFSFRLPPCPGFDFDWAIDVYANLNYTGFNPNGSATLPYYMRRQSWSMCMGIHALIFPPNSAYYEIEANSAASRDIQTLDFRVDVMFVSGRILIGNKETGPIPVGTATEYEVTAPDNSPITQTLYDFDNDGKPDTSTLGEMVEKTLEDGSKVKVFEAKDDGTLQAVYFSSRKDANPEEPDVIRQADTKKNFQANGLLKSISRDDFKKTDILIFRESTGQLVLERRGMSTSDMNSRDADVAKDNAFYYRLMLRGPTDNQLNIGGGITRNGSWEEWSSQYKMTEPFQKREADHLKSGEWIRVVAINRATGYMATQRVQLSDASQHDGGFLNVPLQDMTLMPPNLKVWAERDYTQEYGLEQNSQQKNNIVGAEGAGLSSDDRITIYTEWFDEEGRALPEDLGKDNGEQYGLTGRLAKIVAPDQLQEVAHGDLANFPIAPGRQTQVLRLKDNLTTPEHFYIHVSGTQKDENPDFGTSPEREGILATRPKNVTPFLTPLFDENKDWKSFSAWSQMKRAYDADVIDDEPIKPLPSYAWQYRPEYQFSQISLEVQNILREYTDESGTKHEQELITEQQGEGKIPTIRSDDDLVSIFYSLVMPQIPRLTAIDGEQELVFSLGAQEVKAVVSENGQVRFDQLAQLDYLDPSDFLTIRLYLNHDAGNTLWEWAFTRNGLHVYFQVPGNGEFREGADQQDIEILSLLDDEKKSTDLPKTVPEPIVRTLGGTRLRYRYIQPSLPGIRVDKIKWKINYDGIYCPNYGISTEGCQERLANQPYELANFSGLSPAQLSMYWQPIKKENNAFQAVWENWAGTLTDDPGVDAYLEVDYVLPVNSDLGLPNQPTQANASKIYKRDFKIKTRELKPETDAAKVMVGSDVQILEAMLWQLGISPQKGVGYSEKSNAGSAGSRIYSKRPNGKYTENCDGSDPKVRNIFSSGWSACVSGKVAMEGMVRRFKGRHISANYANQKARSAGDGKDNDKVDGNVDQGMLANLDVAWTNYYSVYADPLFKNRPQILLTDADIQLQLKEVTRLWQDGTTDGYLKPTYTETIHKSVLKLAGLAEDFKTREQLASAWKSRETDSHWGRPKGQGVAYRITEGGGDELGSMSFNQVLFSYRYSKDPIKVHSNSGLNYYHPYQNMHGFAYHTSGKGKRGESYSFNGPMNKAFGDNVMARAYPDSLKGYRHCEKIDECESKTVSTLNVNKKDDDYELLARVMMAYNAGTDGAKSWPDVLAATTPCKGCGTEYSIDVRNSSTKFGMPYRQYIWKGGDGFDVNGNNEIKDIAADPTKVPPVAEVIETTVEWCFAYGELEWLAGKSFDVVKKDASPVDEKGNVKISVGGFVCP